MGKMTPLISDMEYWKKEWRGMPEFQQDSAIPFRSIILHFNDEGDVKHFEEISGQKVTPKTKFLYFPKQERANLLEKKCQGKKNFPPQFPLYIPSRGRWETRYTSKALDAMGVSYLIVVEKQEYIKYAKEVGKKKILVLDSSYQDKYDTCDDLGDSKSKGPGPARNFIWEHSISEGHKWHWVMDDNITEFYRLNRNIKYRVSDGTIFRCMEDFILRYENVGMAGPAYELFVPRKVKCPPYVTNTRIYSCNLIRNDLPFRWRGRYNEDTILSLDMLFQSWATVQFNTFLQNKMGTQRVAGGNTEVFYSKEGTSPKSEMMMKVYPRISKLITRWGRDHHYVDYSIFKRNKLILKQGVKLSEINDEYGMKLL